MLILRPDVKPTIVAYGVFLLAAGGYFLPNYVLNKKVAHRREELSRNFPDALDLLRTCVEAGLSTEAALARVGEEMRIRSRALADELRQVALEQRAGSSRNQALANMAERVGLSDIEAMVSALIQSEKFGTSVSEALRVYSENLRLDRRMKAEEQAAKIPTKILLPLIVCIFPLLFMLILAPPHSQCIESIAWTMRIPSGNFITVQRVCLYGAAMALFFGIVYGIAVRESFWVVAKGKFLFLDFGIFWGVSHLVEQGQAVLAYQSSVISQSIAAGFMGQRPGGFGWFYPPTFFLLIWPLAYLKPPLAYMVFMGATGSLYVAAIVKTLPGRATWWGILGFSGLWLNLIVGQNGFLSAGLLGWALYFLKPRPVLSGVFLGLLTFKPHLGILIPVALVLDRQWRCLISATATFVILSGLTVVFFGGGVWEAWLGNFALVRQNLAQPDPTFLVKLTSVFVLVRLLGFSEVLAYASQWVCSLVVLSVVWRVWRSSLSRECKYACLVLAALLVTPYVFEYDLTWIAVAGVWWVRSCEHRRITVMDQVLAVLLWLLPGLVYLTSLTHWVIPVAQSVLFVTLLHWSRADSRLVSWKRRVRA